MQQLQHENVIDHLLRRIHKVYHVIDNQYTAISRSVLWPYGHIGIDK
jgi:hypothetical protein